MYDKIDSQERQEGAREMDPVIKRLWTGALRSGEYPQGSGQLARADEDGNVTGWCCLGVLCDLAVKAQVIPAPEVSRFGVSGTAALVFGSRRDLQLLPREVQHWAGLHSSNPDVTRMGEEDEASLAELNDDGCKFSEIADLIDKQL